MITSKQFHRAFYNPNPVPLTNTEQRLLDITDWILRTVVIVLLSASALAGAYLYSASQGGSLAQAVDTWYAEHGYFQGAP